jgi:hypothetical protein
MPLCSILKNCRWYIQKGDDACKICFYVLIEIVEKEL